MIDTIKLIIKYLQSDYKISVKGLTNDKQCFIISTVALGLWSRFSCFTPFILYLV